MSSGRVPLSHVYCSIREMAFSQKLNELLTTASSTRLQEQTNESNMTVKQQQHHSENISCIHTTLSLLLPCLLLIKNPELSLTSGGQNKLTSVYYVFSSSVCCGSGDPTRGRFQQPCNLPAVSFQFLYLKHIVRI